MRLPCGYGIIDCVLNETASIFLLAVAALIPLLLGAAWAWQRFYREDQSDTARTIAKNSALPIAANLINKAIDFGFAVIALRFLGPEGNGAYAFVALIAGLYFLTITNWGLNDLTVREAAPDLSRAPRLFSITLLLRLGITTLLLPIAALLVVGYSLLERPLSSAEITALALLMLHLYPAALAAACSASFQAYQRMEVTALVVLLTNVVKTLAGVGALLIAPDAPARVVALAAVALAATVLNAVIFYILQRRMLFRAPLVWDWPTGRDLLREGFPLLLNSLLLAVFFRFDVVLLRAQAGVAALGLYDAAYKVINMTQIVPPYFVAALFPLLARYAVTDRAALERMYHRALGLLQLVAWPVAVGGTLLAPVIIAVLGGRAFLPGAALALAILIWYLPLSYANGVTQYVLIALRRQRAITVAFVIGAVFNLGMNLLLIPAYGYLAAASVTVATEVALLLPFLRTLRREGAMPPLLRLMWRPALASLIMGAAMWPALVLSPWLAIAVGASVYPAALWALGAFGPEERALMRRMLSKSGVSSGGAH
jgi:O-antigen/teichoic acid export membrane protein